VDVPAVCIHDVDVSVPVAIGVEDDAAAVGRPRRVPRDRECAAGVADGEALLAGAVGADRVQMERAVAVGIEQDYSPVWRPLRVRVVSATSARQAALTGPVGVDDVERGVAVARALEDELTSVRRP